MPSVPWQFTVTYFARSTDNVANIQSGGLSFIRTTSLGILYKDFTTREKTCMYCWAHRQRRHLCCHTLLWCFGWVFFGVCGFIWVFLFVSVVCLAFLFLVGCFFGAKIRGTSKKFPYPFICKTFTGDQQQLHIKNFEEFCVRWRSNKIHIEF